MPQTGDDGDRGPAFRIQAAVGQILTADGAVAGAGFLIAADVVITCAHVVRAAGHGPGTGVSLAFPHAAGAPSVEGQVLVEPWRAPDANDVAVIRLRGPVGVSPLPLGSSAGCRGHRVRSFGFPDQAPPGGHFGYGTGGDLLPAPGVDNADGGLLQLTQANDLTQGFSGGPVVDEVTGLVVGMVTAITAPDGYQRGQGIAYATPANVLREAWPALIEHETSPYRGLEPFTTEHAADFHGRDTAVEAVLAALAGHERALLLLGPSGSGKSSLIQAGVLPALSDGRLPGSDRWTTVLVPRPGQDLSVELERHGLTGVAAEFVATIRRPSDAGPQGNSERIVLVIDQFEEALTRPSASALESVRELIDSVAPVSVILVMRDDFYPQLAAQAPQLLEVLTPGLVNIPATLSPQDLHAIVVRPAHEAGASFEEGLAERIIADVLAADPQNTAARRAPVTLLAPLELALDRLWERRVDGRLTHTAYERIGEITGSLATWCNAAITQLPESHHSVARRILTALVRPADPDRHIPATRQQVPLDVLRELAADTADTAPDRQSAEEVTDAVLESLTRHRIVTTAARDPGPPPTGVVAELVHDTLARDWGELRTWVEQDRRFQTWLHRAEEQRARWRDRRHADDLLHGTDLAEGLDWSRQRRLPSATADFVAASRRRQQAAVRRTRRLNAVLAGLLAVALALTGFAFVQRHSAQVQQQVATARLLVSQAEAARISDPRLALQLGIAAERIHSDSQTQASLVETLTGTRYAGTVSGFSNSVRAVAFSRNNILATASSVRTKTAASPDVSLAPANDRAQAGTSATPSVTTVTTTVITLWSLSDTAPPRRLSSRVRVDNIDSDLMVFSPDGRSLLTAYDNSSKVAVWDVSDPAKPVLRTSWEAIKGDDVGSLAYSRDGSILAVGSDYHDRVALWDVSRPDRIRPIGAPFSAGTRQMDSVAFSSDSQVLAVGSDSSVVLWDVTAPTRPHRLGSPLTGRSPVVFTPGRHLLATHDKDPKSHNQNAFVLWDVSRPAAPKRLGGRMTGNNAALAFSPKGVSAATARYDGTTVLWDLSHPDRPVASGSPLTRHTDFVLSVAFSPDGRTLVTGSADHTAMLWNLTDPGQPVPRGKTVAGVQSLAFRAGARALASGAENNSMILWDMSDPARPVEQRTDVPGESGTLSSDGRVLAVVNHGTTTVWDISDVKHPVRRGPALPGSGGPALFSPDGRMLITGDKDKSMLWDLSHPAQPALRAKDLPASIVLVAAFSPDSHTLAISNIYDPGAEVTLWDVADPTHPAPRPQPLQAGDAADITAVAFSPGGRTLAVGRSDGTIALWDVAQPSKPARLGQPMAGPSDPNGNTAALNVTVAVIGMAFSADGRTLATANSTKTLLLWDVTDFSNPHQLAAPLPMPGQQVLTLVFAPDGTGLATVSFEQRAALWDLTGGIDLLNHAAQHACAITGSGLDHAAWSRYVHALSYRKTCVS
ncbi:WD40 repeat protein/energy-coupling factor transporter ATP-binding protein EcfA2 [Streptomyces sp. SAI-208]|uniref:nSTAND1 domain-containing NTPase n=1 Tax=Streptomyces sp. SAI-208 TaxID=2940550 RepID=UPI0024742170|nr:trypsin-like peptidase domain-containing protein [Streptomyces sp. SAI-208]MDH6604552.1 WD40 repeat protein/energy-coupling factor transporter ATP-binding protein EcfA2 [Streptomyces sp. SAI-208]